MILIDAVRKKLLGKKIYLNCKNKKLNVTDDILQKRLNYLHKKGFVVNWDLNSLINFCKLKKKDIPERKLLKKLKLKMDGDEKLVLFGSERDIQADYFPIVQERKINEMEEKKEEKEEDWELINDDIEFTDEKAELDHSDNYPRMGSEGYEMIFLKDNDCKMFGVIESLHQILILNDICFLQGAFVFADQDGKLFDRLLHKCQYNYRRSIKREITHDVFINPDEFDNRKKNSVLDKKFLKEQQLYYPKAINFKFYMFEIPIQHENKTTFDFDYACDPDCRKDETKCSEDLKESKRILLVYPFQVNIFPEKGKPKVVKRFLYMKLEDSPAISMTHLKGAITSYILPFFLGKTKKTYPIRRERITKYDKPYGETEFPELDNRFYQTMNSDMNEVYFYNTYVRNSHEMFIPQNITDDILNENELP